MHAPPQADFRDQHLPLVTLQVGETAHPRARGRPHVRPQSLTAGVADTCLPGFPGGALVSAALSLRKQLFPCVSGGKGLGALHNDKVMGV